MVPDMKPDSKPFRPPSVGRMLNQLTKRLNTQMTKRLKTLGLTLNGFFIIVNLLEQEGKTQADLGARIKLPAYGITRLIDTLEQSALVERRPDPTSRRNHLIFLTPQGRALAPQILAIVHEVNEWLLGGLPTEERLAFSNTLARLV